MCNIDKEILKKRIDESEVFSKHFGTFSKSDYEVLMFTIYLDSLKGKVRDYDISIALGITESKVRNLRVKSQLMYPRDIKWVDELNRALVGGYYDESTGMITVTIEDPSVSNLLKNIIEEKFGTVGKTINSKQLVLPVESFLMLAALSEKDPDKVLDELNKAVKKATLSRKKIVKRPFGERFLKEVPNLINFMGSVAALYTNGKPIIDSIILKIS